MRASPYVPVLITNFVIFFCRTGAKRWSGYFWLELFFTGIISLIEVWILKWITKKLGWNLY